MKRLDSKTSARVGGAVAIAVTALSSAGVLALGMHVDGQIHQDLKAKATSHAVGICDSYADQFLSGTLLNRGEGSNNVISLKCPTGSKIAGSTIAVSYRFIDGFQKQG